MRRLLVVALALCLAGSAFAVQNPTSAKLSLDGKGLSQGDGAVGPRTGGETIATATVIPAIPFSDTGATCSFINDYDEICPYSGSTAPDVVYSFTPTAADPITIDLCASQYDTKVYVYAGGVGNLVACNDDAGCGYSGYQSKVAGVAVTPGVTYYIVVDGYGSSCGTYDLQVSAPPPCIVTCPAGAIMEGEPVCSDNYVDSWNGGCNSTPNVFQTIGPVSGTALDLCGQSGTYLYYGSSYRDTDWFDITALGGLVSESVSAEFPLLSFLMYGLNCSAPGYVYGTADPCVALNLSYSFSANQHGWVWIGPSVFTGVPCGDLSDYVAHITGLAGQVPAEKATWGTIKNLYK